MNTLSAAPPTIELGVNIDHVATLRNARGTSYPDPVHAALLAEDAGADAITLHLREDRRHIREADVIAIRNQIVTRMNLECAVTPEMIDFACAIRPHDVCLVPERRAELTTEGGLDVTAGLEGIRAACARLAAHQIRVSLFIDPNPAQIRSCVEAGAPVIELHTGRYANAHEPAERERELARIREAVHTARALGLKVNAGHGLHYENVEAIAALIDIAELNIGHAIVARAVFSGWDAAIRDMKALMVGARLAALRVLP